MQVVSVRIVTDRDGKPKGFGYVEFETLDGLKDALAKSGASLAGRQVRVGVAEAPKQGDRGGFGNSIAEEASQWRRAGPLPPGPDGPSSRPGMSRDRPSFAARDGPSGFDQMEVSGSGRSGFGSKFTPSAAPPVRSGSGGPFRGSGPGPLSPSAEPAEPSKGEVASDWRTGKPRAELAPPVRPRSGFTAEGSTRSPSFRARDATDVDDKYASQERMGFGSKFSPAPTPPESPAGPARGGPPRFGPGAGPADRRNGPPLGAPAGPSEGAETWRSARPPPTGPRGATPQTSPPSQAASPAAAAPQAERRKLTLAPRSATSEAAAPSSASASSKASPFGNAKPVDSLEKEREIEERLRKEREQRAADEKAKQEKIKADREKALKDAPTGPRADRERTAAGAKDGVKSPRSGAAPAAAPALSTEENSTSKDEATASTPAPQEAPKAKAPAPTGAWGQGRKPSGHLTSEGSTPTTNGSNSDAAPSSDDKVESLTTQVEKTSVA